ncbi:hypothetical protein MKS88_004257 [Plasmodium brasilianum]|uniref:Uncharacterized protein n=1 Tax=Plasmodium brasilianum TaxID=5824 RepID=A0ACB9Y497_PLABR|nr:hypothetical protein MKS88_004257 [Plasmodium brasilianum]
MRTNKDENIEPNAMDNYENNAKTSFFDDAISIESKKEVDYELLRSTKNVDTINDIKICNINVNNEMESAMFIHLKKRKTTSVNDKYYSLKFPKFIDVCTDIKRGGEREMNIRDTKYDTKGKDGDQIDDAIDYKNDHTIDRSGSMISSRGTRHSIEVTHSNKKTSSIVTWSFEEDLCNKIQIKKNSKKIYKKKEQEYSFKGECKNKCITSEDEMCANKLQKEEDLKNSILSKWNTMLSDRIKNNPEQDNMSDCLTDECMSDFSNMEEFYKKYEIDYNSDDDIMSVSSNESNEHIKNVCRNLHCLETNSFIVQYDDGKSIFFVNEKPFILEEDSEINYLVESTNDTVMPIHCKLEKKFFIKSIAKEEHISPSDLKLKKDDIYYSLNDAKLDKLKT